MFQLVCVFYYNYIKIVVHLEIINYPNISGVDKKKLLKIKSLFECIKKQYPDSRNIHFYLPKKPDNFFKLIHIHINPGESVADPMPNPPNFIRILLHLSPCTYQWF